MARDISLDLLRLGMFRAVLPHRRFTGGSRVYALLIGVGFGISALCMAVLPLLRFSWQGFGLFVASFAVSFYCWYDFVWQEVVFPKKMLRQILDLLVIAPWWVLVVLPIAYTSLGDWPLVGATLGMMLSWSLLGVEVYRFKRDRKRSGMEEKLVKITPSSAADWRLGIEVVASTFVLLSAGVMLWMLVDVMANPSYYEFEGSLADWIQWGLLALLYVGAIFVLVQAFRRAQARLFLLSAMMSAFSFTGALSVVAEILVWWGYKKRLIPWGNEERVAGIMQDERAMSRALSLVSAAAAAGAATLAGYVFKGPVSLLLIAIASALVGVVLFGAISALVRRLRRPPSDEH